MRLLDLTLVEKSLDPGMGVPLANLVALLILVPFVAVVAEHHPRRYSLTAEHHGQGGGKVLAVSAAMVGNEIVNGIDRRVTFGSLQAILELAGTGELPLETAGHIVMPVLRKAAFPQPLGGKGLQPGQRQRIAGHLQIRRYGHIHA